jgi:hypothetical protein
MSSVAAARGGRKMARRHTVLLPNAREYGKSPQAIYPSYGWHIGSIFINQAKTARETGIRR